MNQTSDKAHDTIVTSDSQPSYSVDISAEKSFVYATFEETHSFDSLMNCYMPCEPVTITTSQSSGTLVVVSYSLPKDFYSILIQAPAIFSFESFVYSTFKCDFNVVVNANRFQCGKAIVANLCDAFQGEEQYTNIQASLSRHHVVLDLAANMKGTYKSLFDSASAGEEHLAHSENKRCKYRGVCYGLHPSVKCFIIWARQPKLNYPSPAILVTFSLRAYRIGPLFRWILLNIWL